MYSDQSLSLETGIWFPPAAMKADCNVTMAVDACPRAELVGMNHGSVCVPGVMRARVA
ncbi:MAG: hypothetical protein ACR2NX_09625 [Chthoniobacterales bacterium]